MEKITKEVNFTYDTVEFLGVTSDGDWAEAVRLSDSLNPQAGYLLLKYQNIYDYTDGDFLVDIFCEYFGTQWTHSHITRIEFTHYAKGHIVVSLIEPSLGTEHKKDYDFKFVPYSKPSLERFAVLGTPTENCLIPYVEKPLFNP